MNNIFQATSTYIKRQVSCQLSQVHQHCSLLCIDKRPTEVFQPFQVSGSALHLFVQVIFQSHSVDNKKLWKLFRNFVQSQTFFVQYIDGTGLPEALHSRVTAPPFRAVIWPLEGTARTLGGTEKNSFNEHTHWKFTMENRLLVVNMLSLYL